MAKGFPLKMRGRLGGARREIIRKKLKKMNEVERLENTEERLEMVADEIAEEIEEIEKIKNIERSKKEFSFVGGKITELALQDFVGAAFGAMFFVVTQEVWELSLKLQLLNSVAVVLLGFFLGFSLIYFSRRRKFVSTQVFHTAFLRGVEIYSISLLTSLAFVSIFGTAQGVEMVKQAIVIAMPAVVSAASADLLFY